MLPRTGNTEEGDAREQAHQTDAGGNPYTVAELLAELAEHLDRAERLATGVLRKHVPVVDRYADQLSEIASSIEEALEEVTEGETDDA